MELTLYYRENCDLCDAMRKALDAFGREVSPVEWREVDIDRSAELIRRYDTRVPVLCAGDTEVCHYFLDRDALGQLLH